MSAPLTGCSSWAQVEDLAATVAPLHTEEQWCGYLAMATDILWAATGRRWRGVSLTAEVALRAAPPRAGEGGWVYDRSWGHCACYAGTGILGPRWSDGAYSHHEPVKIRLPNPDVTSVTSVTIDGEAFDEWRLDGAWLVRTDGRGWPECRDRAVVTYVFGEMPPAAGVAAVVALATEFGRAASDNPDQACALPQRLQSVSRQGITFEVLDTMEFLDKGWTGLLSTDMWIKSVNPKGRSQAGQVWSPDLRRGRKRTS